MEHPALTLLRRAFDRAAAAGTPRPVWWRDDDAVDVTPALDALGRIAARHGASVALAVVPEGATPALLARAAEEGWAVLQHGVRHANHQTSGKAAELGDGREVPVLIAECLAARERLAGAQTFLPVMVPPWNRMRRDLAPALRAAGWRGLSMSGEPPATAPIRRFDTHIDPIDWSGGARLLAPAALEGKVRRAVAVGGPIGLLTHHLVHTAEVSAFVDDLAAIVSAHPGARWTSAGELWGGR